VAAMPQLVKARHPVLVTAHRLAVDQAAAHLQFVHGPDDERVAGCPVMPVPGQHAGSRLRRCRGAVPVLRHAARVARCRAQRRRGISIESPFRRIASSALMSRPPSTLQFQSGGVSCACKSARQLMRTAPEPQHRLAGFAHDIGPMQSHHENESRFPAANVAR
jgi:hypothetical protein